MRARGTWIVIGLCLTTAACAGSSAADVSSRSSVGSAAISETAAFDAEVGDLAGWDFLGWLVGATTDSAVKVVDSEGAEILLDDGTRIVAGQGAFHTTAEVTAQIADLDFAPHLDPAPWGQVYLVSTAEPVALAQPVTIEIPRPAADLRAMQLIDGALHEVPVLGDATASVEIPHFSEVITMVVEAVNAQQASVPEPDHGAADASFLRACIVAVNGLFGGEEAGGDDARLAGDWAFSICTTALVNRASPSGVRVSTACVGDRIGGDIDLRGAIALCAEEQASDSQDPAGDGAANADDGPDASGTDSDHDEPPVEPGPSAWSGNLTLREGSSLTPYGDLTIDLDREPGTDTFTLHMVVGSQSVTEFFQIGECTTVIVKTYDGTGTFSDQFDNALSFVGTQDVDWQYPDCSGIKENDNVRPDDPMIITITDTGLSGAFEGFEFVLDGVPRPLAG